MSCSDPWLEQEDVRSRIQSCACWNGDWIPCAEERDSYVEHLSAVLLPVLPRKAAATLTSVVWDSDFDLARDRIAQTHRRRNQYLGLRFRRLLGLRLGEKRYWLEGKIIAEKVSEADGISRLSTIQVRRTAVLRFLGETGQTLLWCLRSQRFSERSPVELGLALGLQVLKGPTFHYEFTVKQLPEDEKERRARMTTMTELYGKAILSLRSAGV